MQGLKQGADQNCDVDVGAMTTKEQMKKVQDQLRDAKSKGARIFANPPSSGLNPAGLFIPPTIVESATDDMLLMREEIFGPVLGVASVKDVDEAVRKANASTLGLTASVWSRNKKNAHAIAARLEVGSVMINDHLMSHGLAETPWGGFKESGIGRTHGYLGLEEMTQPRVVVDDMLPGMQKNMWWYPHSRKVFDGLLGGLDVLYAKRLTKRLAGVFKLVPVFLRSFQK
jgi:succinate-semialdehyde dehydrogenase/glutarate-semialdehyde dehydrogenase